MRLLLDQGLPRTAVEHLANLGVFSEHVAALGMASATDRDILAAAAQRQAVIVTLDADFHMILAASHARGPSVIRIRREGLRAPEIAAVIRQVIDRADIELREGAVVSVTEARIRVRRLPLIR